MSVTVCRGRYSGRYALSREPHSGPEATSLLLSMTVGAGSVGLQREGGCCRCQSADGCSAWRQSVAGHSEFLLCGASATRPHAQLIRDHAAACVNSALDVIARPRGLRPEADSAGG
jgi:hypothetical protein